MNNPNGGGLAGNAPVPSSTPSLPSAGEPLDPEVEELWSSRALLLVLVLLIGSFWVSYYLKVRRIRSIHETIIALFSGMFVGALVRLSPGHVVQDMIAFRSTILLNVLLPPIILNSGYQLKQEQFFRSFAVILSFAFAGTFISAVALGIIVYLYSLLGLEGLSLTIVECLLFGSTLSATDPVTILAIFNALHVDPKLYSVIFGESILNDAVAIVMFETLSQFHGEKIHVLSFFHGVGIFLLTFFISMALGVIFGLGCSLMLKHSELGRYTEIEACLVFLIAYTSYFFSNALTMSGIVTLLFCGITLKHYAYHNMSRRTQRSSRYMFGSLASLAENYIFILLGLSLFTEDDLVYKPLFILVTAFAMCVARYCAVFPISKLINIVFRARGARTDEIPHSYQQILFWAGLRGAVGVALAEGMKGEHAIALRTTVLVGVVLTVVVFGGTIQRVLEVVGIRTGVVDEEDDETDEEAEYALTEQDVEDRVGGGGGAGSSRPPLAFGTPGTSHHFATLRNSSSSAAGPSASGKGGADPFRETPPPGARRAPRPRLSGGTSISPSSASNSDSDNDVLPSPTSDPLHSAAQSRGLGQAWTALDEQYLLPVFSNATASRHANRNKASAKAKRASTQFAGGGGGGSGEEGEEGGGTHPYGHEGGKVASKSLGDVVSALVAPALSSSASSPSRDQPPLPLSSSSLYASPNSPYPSVDLAAASSMGARRPARSRGGSHAPTGSGSFSASSSQQQQQQHQGQERGGHSGNGGMAHSAGPVAPFEFDGGGGGGGARGWRRGTSPGSEDSKR